MFPLQKGVFALKDLYLLVQNSYIYIYVTSGGRHIYNYCILLIKYRETSLANENRNQE